MSQELNRRNAEEAARPFAHAVQCYYCTAPGVYRCTHRLGNSRQPCGRALCPEHAGAAREGVVCRQPSEIARG